MKPLILALCLTLCATNATARERKLHHIFGKPYVFLPDPGGWNADHTQYENERILYIEGYGTFCKGRPAPFTAAEEARRVNAAGGAYVVPVPPPLSKEECDYWTLITFEKGKVDRNEGIEIGLVATTFLFDAYSTQRFGTNWEGGCHEVGSLGLIGAHPGPWALLAYNGARTLVFALPALSTPLSKSSARIMAPVGGYLGWHALKAARHNIAIGCGG